MSFEWSKEQDRIINADDGDLLASASAGSGKTTVMLERVRRLIVDKHIPIRKIVLLSFNKAIAKEIKIRLIEMLESEVVSHPELAVEIDNIDTAPITTIDGFCNSLVTEYFERLNICADSSILEGTAQITMLNGVIAGIIKDLKAASDENIYGMIEKFGSEKNLIEAIGEVYNFACVVPDREKWLNEACNGTPKDAFDKIFSQYVEKLNKRHAIELKNAEELLCQLNGESSAYNILNLLINAMSDILKSKNYSELYLAKRMYEPMMTGMRLAFKKDETIDIDNAKGQIKLLRTNVKNIFEDFSCDYAEAYNKFEKTQRDSSELARYALLTHLSFSDLKKSLGVLDFADLTYYAAKLLQDDDLSNEISAKYDYIFIDEYQDTNFIGEYILSRISRNNLFMVGDAKQSIYGFRLAEPQIMIDKIQAMKRIDMASKHTRQELTCINLNDNYRSDNNILEFVNGIFDVIMTKNFGGIDYSVSDRFCGKAHYEKVNNLPSCEIAWVYTPKPDKTQQKSELIENGDEEKNGLYNPFKDDVVDKEDSAAVTEGKYIASAIKNYIGQYIYDSKTKTKRKAEARDICILSRYCIKRGNKTDKIIKAIEAEGINIAVDGLIKREEADEVAIIIEMLKVIDNDTQEIPLAAVLKSVWCGMTSAEMAEIRRGAPDIEFYKAVRILRGKNDKITRLYEIIDDLRLRLAYNGVYDIINALVYEFGYDKQLLADNADLGCVREYIEGLHGYGGTLNEFVNSALPRYDTDGGYDINTDNRVKAMTIHACKGLEFPIIILIGADEKFKNLNTNIVVNRNYGIAVNLYDEKRMIKSDNFILKTLRKFKRDKETEEEMRLFYVALTRAKNHLLITGTVSENSMTIDEYTAPYNITCYKDWLDNAVRAGSIPRKSVRVTEYEENKNETGFVMDKAVDITVASKEIEKILKFKYPFASSTIIGLKHTVTELITSDTYEDIPIFSGFYDEETDKAIRGTNYHIILEHIDYGANDCNKVKAELERMVNENLIDELQIDNIDVDEIVRLLNSDFIKKALEDNSIYMREKQFMLRAKASEFFDCTSDDNILIQGAIDLIIDSDELIVVDFKKSRKSRESLISTYSRQLEIYARAVEQAMGKKVNKKIIYEIGRGETIIL